MKVFSRMRAAMFLSAGLLFAVPAFAAGDSDADSATDFGLAVQTSSGVVLRVPVDASGKELTTAAELRLHTGADLSTSGDFQGAFAAGQPLAVTEQVSKDDISKDSSTRGWFGGRGAGWGANSCGGWQSNYYRSYTPSYYNYGTYYNYGYSSSRNYFGNAGGYAGYRYYYYNRCW